MIRTNAPPRATNLSENTISRNSLDAGTCHTQGGLGFNGYDFDGASTLMLSVAALANGGFGAA